MQTARIGGEGVAEGERWATNYRMIWLSYDQHLRSW